MLLPFLSPTPSLKICGVTTLADTTALAELGVHALGFNFWPSSKRYCSPEIAAEIAPSVSKKILRVGVFVNNAIPLAEELIAQDLIDVVQLHGDETLDDINHFLEQNIPVIRAVSATKLPSTPLPTRNFALLIDTPAGSDYGGTGKTFDWSLASDFIKENPDTPVILAGGLTPENAAEALQQVRPVALDIASGAETAPGQKDFQKVKSLLDTITQNS